MTAAEHRAVVAGAGCPGSARLPSRPAGPGGRLCPPAARLPSSGRAGTDLRLNDGRGAGGEEALRANTEPMTYGVHVDFAVWLTSARKLLEHEPEWSWRDAETREAAAAMRDLITSRLEADTRMT